jgi:hypothetical protein
LSLVPLPLPAPLHEQINPAIGDRREPEPLVEPARRIEAFDVDAQPLPAGGGLCLERAHQRRPQAAVAVAGQQGDVDDADLVGPAGDVEPSDRLAIEDDDVEAGVGLEAISKTICVASEPREPPSRLKR